MSPTLVHLTIILLRAAVHVTLIAAQSVDGFITRHSEPGSGFTSLADKTHFRNALRTFDCRVMGATTYRVSRDITRRAADSGSIQRVVTRTPAAFTSDAISPVLEFTDRPPAEILLGLEKHGCRRCALVGGAQVHSLFLRSGCVDELWLTVEPLLFGRGTPLLSEEAEVKLSLLSHEPLSPDTLLLKYRVKPVE